MENLPATPTPCLGGYELGPSGIEFTKSVTVTIPYSLSGNSGQAYAYWYDSVTGALSQMGITEYEDIEISGDLHALRFKTTHFTPYFLLLGAVGVAASGGGGGCNISPTNPGNAVEFIIPYVGLAVIMIVLRIHDKRKYKTNH